MGTLEKLKTVHKKLGGGRAEYWTGLTAHLQALVVADKVQHEEISKYAALSFLCSCSLMFVHVGSSLAL